MAHKKGVGSSKLAIEDRICGAHAIYFPIEQASQPRLVVARKKRFEQVLPSRDHYPLPHGGRQFTIPWPTNSCVYLLFASNRMKKTV